MTHEAGKTRLLLAACGILALALASAHARVERDIEPVIRAATAFPQGALLNLGHAANHYYLYNQLPGNSFTRQRQQDLTAVFPGDPGCDCSQGVTRVIPP